MTFAAKSTVAVAIDWSTLTRSAQISHLSIFRLSLLKVPQPELCRQSESRP